jgi:hypothetical protein
MTADKKEGVAINVKWFEIDQVHQKMHAAAEDLPAGAGGRLFIANVTGGCLYKIVTDSGVAMTFAQYAPQELVRHK